MTMGANLAGILPELVLVVTVLALVIADIGLRRHAARRTALAILALLGTVIAAVALAWSPLPPAASAGAPHAGTSLFDGMIAHDGFALFFKGLFLAAAFLGLLFGAISNEISRGRYGEYVVLLLCLTLGMSFLASARNLLMIYLALEMVSMPSYILTGFRRGDRPSSEAALKYVVYGAASSGIMLYGFSLLYGLTGTLDLAGIGRALAQIMREGSSAHALGVTVAALASLVGFGYKVAAVPFHMWCPDVYQGAPTPFVAFLSVGPKAAGFAALLRFVIAGFGSVAAPAAGHATAAATGAIAGTFPWPALIGVLSIATMTVGNLIAISQENVKRLLAYSSIAHAGYMLMAVAVGTEPAVRAVMLYLPIYLFMNMGAFLAVMAVRASTGDERIAAFRGLGSRSPFLAISLAVFLFSLTGLPPLAGFIGKFFLFASLIRTGSAFFYVVALIGVLNSVVSLYYYVRIVRAMFLEKAEAGERAPLALARPTATLLAVCAVPTILLGVWWGPLMSLIDRAAMLIR
ncbi:MAG: NADH-quinone oxidoreductase subunit N [Candidatus Eisenbacteria bacterium]|nr:NADH-quinone oxidoreductase subunit N [Candidatus Eisenbacteria bacterium]